LEFQINDDCPIGKHYTSVSIQVADASPSNQSRQYVVPVSIAVMEGLEISPTSISLGFRNIQSVVFPQRDVIKISGLSGRRISSVSINPLVDGVTVEIIESTDNSVLLQLVVSEGVVVGRPLEFAIETSLCARSLGGRRDQIVIPVAGIFFD
jgi:hypothetical protein